MGVLGNKLQKLQILLHEILMHYDFTCVFSIPVKF